MTKRKLQGDLVGFYRNRQLHVDWAKGTHGADAAYLIWILHDKQLDRRLSLHKGERLVGTLDDGFTKIVELPSALENLADRGYDLNTLRFSIDKVKA